MLRQICADYSGIGDFRKLTIAEIKFFYTPLLPGLVETSKPTKT